MKTCKNCLAVKELSQFYHHKKTKDGRGSWCKECLVARTAEKRKDPVEKDRYRQYAWRNTLKKRYGITEKEWQALYDKQKGCAICGRNDTGGRGIGSRLAVDHDHKSGKIRGLLCTNCNNGLGRFKDDPELLTKAIEYLKQQP